MTTLAKGGTAAATTSLVLTLTAGAAVGSAVCVFLRVGAAVTSVVDSRGNTYTTNTLTASGTYVWTTIVTVDLISTDTITISFTSNTVAAVAVNLTGQGQAIVPTSGATGAVAAGSGASSGSSTSVTLSAGQVPAAPGADMLAIMVASISTGAVSGDFSSVDSSYSLADSQFTSGTGTQRAIAIYTKALSVASPMATQNPTVTLANSRAWNSNFLYAVAPTDRGAHANDIFGGASTATAKQRAALGAPETFGSIKKINGLVALKSRDGLL